MKRLIPLFAAALFACSPALPPAPRPPEPTPVEVAPVAPQPTTVSHGDWKITLPVGWTFDDVPQLSEAGTTTVLTAKSAVKIGRGFIRLSIDQLPFKGPMTDELFALALAENYEEMFGAKMVQAEDVEVDGHTSVFLTLVQVDVGRGFLVLASARGKVGYVVVCTGDAVKPVGEVVGKTCVEVLKTFHSK